MMPHSSIQSQQETQEQLILEQIASVYAGGDANKAQFICSAIEDGLQAARSNVEQCGPLELRRFLTAEQYENGEGDESTIMRGSELCNNFATSDLHGLKTCFVEDQF